MFETTTSCSLYLNCSQEESFASFKRKRSSPRLGSSPSSVSPRESESRKTPDPRYPLKNEHSSLDEARLSASTPDRTTNVDITTKEKKWSPKQLGLHGCNQCGSMILACDSDLQQHNQKHKTESQDKLPTSCTASPIPMSTDIPSSSRSLSIQRKKSPQPHRQFDQVPTSIHKLEPSIAFQQASLSQSAAAPPLLPRESEGDHGTMEDDESCRPTKVKKSKQKSNQQGSHICKLCDITFTRHFDLQRHNQKHQVEPEEDMSRRTCTNCDRVLSRVDATKRHVDTLPESCNYLRRKQGLESLPTMPDDHYDACRVQYYKLAQERKKPKGRKKANAAV